MPLINLWIIECARCKRGKLYSDLKTSAYIYWLCPYCKAYNKTDLLTTLTFLSKPIPANPNSKDDIVAD